MLKQLLATLKVLMLAIVLSFGLSYALAWTSPTATPPGANVAAPLNASATDQVKAGGLTAGSLTTTGAVTAGSVSTTGLTNTGTLRVTTGAGATKVLTSDASGNATWQAAAGGGDNLGNHTATQALNMAGFGISGASTVVASDVFAAGRWMSQVGNYNLRVFTASGTYVPTAGLLKAKVTVVGGGGAGASNPWQTGGPDINGTTHTGGGGGGGTAINVFSAATIGASKAVTVGAGGTGTNWSGGNPGGTSSFGALLSATGGSGGWDNSTSVGGTGSGGLLNIRGGGSTDYNQQGGSSMYGEGAAKGSVGQAYGGGAGSTVNTAAGPSGAAGVVIIEEYF